MTTEPRQPQTLPPARQRTRRHLEIDDAPARAPAVPPRPQPRRTDEPNAFEYQSVGLNPNIASRYRQIKALEGQAEAKAWAKTQITRMIFSGIPVREIAQQFQFSVDWTRTLIDECRAEMRQSKLGGYDAGMIVAEHMSIYSFIRENAFFTMQKVANVTEMDKHRARESLLATMRQEVEFLDKLGGMRGLTLTAVQDDDATVAAKQMGDRLQTILSQFSEIDAEIAAAGAADDDGDDDTAYLPGEEPDPVEVFDEEQGVSQGDED